MSGEEVDIGHGVTIEVRRLDGKIAGVAYEHTCLNGHRSPGWIPVKPEAPNGWDLVSADPITLSPSLLCRTCGHHGFIRDGRWVPA